MRRLACLLLAPPLLSLLSTGPAAAGELRADLLEPLPPDARSGDVRVVFHRWHDPRLRREWAEFRVENPTDADVLVCGDVYGRPSAVARYGDDLGDRPAPDAPILRLPAGYGARFDRFVAASSEGAGRVGIGVRRVAGAPVLVTWSAPVDCRPAHEPMAEDDAADRVEVRVIDVDPRNGADARVLLELVNPSPFDVSYQGLFATPAVVWTAADTSSRRMLSQPCGNARREYELPPGHKLVFDPGDFPLEREHPFVVRVVGEGSPRSAPITLPPRTIDVPIDGEVRLTVLGDRPGWSHPDILLANGSDGPITYEGRSPVAPSHGIVVGAGPAADEHERRASNPKRFTLPTGKGIVLLQLHLSQRRGRPQRLALDVTRADGETERLLSGPVFGGGP